MTSALTNPNCPRCGSVLRQEQCGGLCSRCLAGSLFSREDMLESSGASEHPVRFDNLVLIGSGGMGAVYEAYDRKLARAVALKFLHAHLLSDSSALIRFELEGLISSQLEHPGVIPVHDVGRDVSGRPFYVMRKIRGETLADVLNRLKTREPEASRKYDFSALVAVFEKLCRTIAYAHSRKIIHRDLKPANIMLGEFGEVFVMDWGLAKMIERAPAFETLIEHEAILSEMNSCERERTLRLATISSETNPDAVLGTLGFMAPEQADGNVSEADQRTDIYALGGILYNILTLHPPVIAQDVRSLLHKTAAGEIPNPLEYQGRNWFSKNHSLPHCPRGRIPAALAEIAMKALSKLPSRRYPSVDALLEDLAAWCGKNNL